MVEPVALAPLLAAPGPGIVSPGALGGMALTALVIVLTPGPNMMYLVSRSIGQGRRAGLISLAGTGVGFGVYLLMATLGLAVVFAAVPWLFISVKVAGVVYLAYLAWQALRPGGRGVFEVRDVVPTSAARLFRMGLLTNLLNPKTAIVYLTLIPQFIDPARGHPTLQGLVLGLVQVAFSLGVNGIIVLGAGSLAAFLGTRPRRLVWQRRLTAGLLGGVAVLLAREVPARARV